jgi:predicted permease
MLASGNNLLLPVAPDWRVLTFTCGVSLLTCLLAGLAPGLRAMQVNLNPGLKEAKAGGSHGVGKGLVIAQLAISMVLVVGATLFIGTLVKLHRVERGIRTEGVLTFGLSTAQQYPAERTLAIRRAALDRIVATPGVVSASASRVTPIGGGLWDSSVQVEGYTFRPDESETVGFNAIAPQYFATLSTPVLAGREFDEHDTGASKKVAVVNESFARYFFGAQSPLGRNVTSVRVTYEIVGVVRDAKYQDLRTGIIKTMYIPWTQREGVPLSSYAYFVLVASGDPMRLAAALERAVRQADPGLHLRGARAYETVVDESIVTERVLAALGGFFGILAMVVACLGMFGVMAFQVSRRTNEFGVRMALGACGRDVIRMVLREAAVMLAAGALIGSALALTLTRLAATLLFGVTPTDPGVFLIAAGVLCVAALAAGWLPARRASRIDPMAALRHE